MTMMRENDFEFNEESTRTVAILAALGRGVFHVTTPSGYVGIRDSGSIDPSKSATHYPASFSRQKGWVALFDARVSQKKLDDIRHGTWLSFFPPRGSHIAIGLQIDEAMLQATMQPNSVGYPSCYLSIPWIECWSSEPIPWAHVIAGFIVVQDGLPIPLNMDGGRFPQLDSLLDELFSVVTS
jgi:hypothetical protein